MFDDDESLYRWRELFSDFDLDDLPDLGLEERKGIDVLLRQFAGQPAIQSPKTSGNSAAAPSMAPVSR